MKRLHFVLVLLVCAMISKVASAHPAIADDGVRNSASYALAGLPNSSIAEGSVFVVFGSNLGPAKLVQVSSFPLPTSAGLAGTSIQITVNGTTVFAIMLYTLSTQVAAVVPSNTPIGTGTLTVTYNGQTSKSAPITVVKSSFGIFATNQSGSGQGVLQNVISQSNRPFNSPTASAQPGQVMILWGTGLGPVSGSEAGQPLPGDMPNWTCTCSSPAWRPRSNTGDAPAAALATIRSFLLCPRVSKVAHSRSMSWWVVSSATS